jgi:phosphate transport system protein
MTTSVLPSADPERDYQQELQLLRDRLLAMGGMVEAAIARSVAAVTERDSVSAERVKVDDREINRVEVEIDDICRHLLSLRQPQPGDLRFITTALKIVVDLERMGDLAVNIAERALDLNQAPQLRPYLDLSKLAELAQNQLKKALDAFVEGDASSAREVLKSDDLLDALFLKIFNELLLLMMEDSKNIRRATSLLFVAKHLERLGDHVTNVGEMVVYRVNGTDIRHPRSRSLD